MTPEYTQQELERLNRCERFCDPSRRNWPWKEAWQEAIERHRRFLLGQHQEKDIEQEAINKMNRVTVEYFKKGLKINKLTSYCEIVWNKTN